MEIADTIEGMLSNDYKERLKAEYQQLSIRLKGVNRALLDEKVPYKDMLRIQRNYMVLYKDALGQRLDILGINLD